MPKTPQSSQPKTTLHTVLKKYVVLFAALECIAILAVGWFVLIGKEFTQVRSLQTTAYEENQATLTEKRSQLAQLEVLAQQYTDVSGERMQQIDQILPVGIDTVSVIAHMHRFAEQAGVTITDIDVAGVGDDTATSGTVTQPPAAAANTAGSGPRITDPSIHTATITLSVRSQNNSYADMKALLGALETFTPILDLQQISYSNNTNTFALQLNTYYSEEQEGIATP